MLNGCMSKHAMCVIGRVITYQKNISASVVDGHVRSEDVEMECGGEQAPISSPLLAPGQQQAITQPGEQIVITPNRPRLWLCNECHTQSINLLKNEKGRSHTIST